LGKFKAFIRAGRDKKFDAKRGHTFIHHATGPL
jgi:hypothetical protein